LLSVSQRFHTDQRTWFFATQVRADIEKNAVVHKKGVALLLLLFQYKAFKEQPIDRWRQTGQGCEYLKSGGAVCGV
jgi:hypothetical protein